MISNLYDTDQLLKQKAVAYFKGSKDAEDAMGKYESIKYDADMSIGQRQGVYDNMVSAIKKAKEKEVEYKEIVDNANSFVQMFRQRFQSLEKKMIVVEKERCEKVHSTINQFVVYEKFAEMNNKYDVNNFSKIIEEYNTEEELKSILQFIGINKCEADFDQFDKEAVPKYEFAPYEFKKYNILNMQQ